MSALSDIREKDFDTWTRIEKCIVEVWEMQGLEWMAEEAATEQATLRAELATAKARAKTAEENWHKNEARLGRDGLIFMECMKLLGLDVSGTDPEAIPAAIKRLKGVA